MINGIKTYCINLDRREDRWERVRVETDLLGIDLIRFPAIDIVAECGKDGSHAGCNASHKALLEMVKQDGIFMAIEDDLKILVDNPTELIRDAYSQLPDDWDVFYLGATLNQDLERYSKNLFRVKGAWTLHAVIYNNQNGVVDYILNNHGDQNLDVFMADDVQHKFNCYIIYPMVATQLSGYSDIRHKEVDYGVIKERYDKYVEE